MDKSCALCIHNRFDPDLGITVCNLYAHPTQKHTDDDDATSALQAHLASKCSGFSTSGGQLSEIKVRISVGAAPALNAQATASSINGTRTKPMGCSRCKYYVQPEAVAKEFGFAVGMCGVFGELVGNKNLIPRASICDFGDEGTPRTSTDGIFLDPRFDLKDMPVARMGAALAGAYGFDPNHQTSVDPREWATEKEVTEEERLAGIKAWRLVPDPKGKRPAIPMPIFDWSALGIDSDPRLSYGEHKPDLYVDHEGLLYSFAFLYLGGITTAQAFNEYLVLIGEAGTGKTEFWCYVAWLMDLPFVRISLRGDTDSSELFGGMDLIDSSQGGQVTSYTKGRFTKFYTQPCVICLDEPNVAPPAIWHALRSSMDSAGQLAVEAIGQVFERDAYCFIGLAMNPPDPAYVGARELSIADKDRIRPRKVELPGEAIERGIIKRHCEAAGYEVSDKVLDKIMRIAERFRGLYREGGSLVPWGIRPQVAVAKMTAGFDLEDAYRLGVLDHLEPEAADVLLGIVRTHS